LNKSSLRISCGSRRPRRPFCNANSAKMSISRKSVLVKNKDASTKKSVLLIKSATRRNRLAEKPNKQSSNASGKPNS